MTDHNSVTMSDRPAKPGRIIAYDVIRVMSFLMIVIHHVAEACFRRYSPLPPETRFLYMGALGVTLFIVISARPAS